MIDLLITIVCCVAFVTAMFLAIGHVWVVHQEIYDGVADHPFHPKARWNTGVAIVCLIIAYLIPSPSYAATTDDIDTQLTSTFELLLARLPSMETDDDAKDFIRLNVIPLTDTHRTARLMLGKHWKRAKDHQRNAFVEAMTDNLVNTYSAFLLDKDAGRAKFNIVRISEDVKKKGSKFKVVATVKIDVVVDLGFSIIQPTGSAWKIYDVQVEGISMVQNWRSTFNTLLRNQSLDSLISDIRDNNIKLQE